MTILPEFHDQLQAAAQRQARRRLPRLGVLVPTRLGTVLLVGLSASVAIAVAIVVLNVTAAPRSASVSPQARVKTSERHHNAALRGRLACRASQVRVQPTKEQGTAEEALFIVYFRDLARPCVLVGDVDFVIDRAGRPIHLNRNPLQVRFHDAVIDGSNSRELIIYWANWCQARRPTEFAGVLTYERRTYRMPVNILPACINRADPSGLSASQIKYPNTP